jgi:hypothetical protein
MPGMDDITRADLTVERLLELGDIPIDDDASLLERARSVVREGLVRRLWLLRIDADGLLVPQLTLIDDTPVTPEAEALGALRRLIGGLAETGCSVAIVLERPGPPRPSPDDWAWHDVLRRAGDAHAGALRGVLLAHSGGVDALGAAPPSPVPPG